MKNDGVRSFEASILVPGAAGAAGIDAIRSLRSSHSQFGIIATDGEPLAAGFLFSDRWHVIPSITDAEAFRQAQEIIRSERVRIILPTSLTDTAVYSRHKQQLSEEGVIFAGSGHATVSLCDDKLAFYESVRNEFAVPEFVSMRGGGPVDYPCFVKPRWGSGGHNAGLCRNRNDYDFYASTCDELLVQEFLGGTEYSVDILSDMDGNPLVAVPRERLAILGGVSLRARVTKSPEIEDLCLTMAKRLGLMGVSCIQLRRNEDGKLKFLEVNAHLAGTAIATKLAGIDLVEKLVMMVLGKPFEIPDFQEITVIRYLDSLIAT